MLFAQLHGPDVFRRYHDAVFERFWKRDLDIENTATLAGLLTQAGANGFEAFLPEGLVRVESIGQAAEADGVFGVPTFMLNGEMFWGGEHLPDIRALLRDRDAPRAL